nr:MAG TPA: hypothetical protein [Caudoviricetes sp.]
MRYHIKFTVSIRDIQLLYLEWKFIFDSIFTRHITCDIVYVS